MHICAHGFALIPILQHPVASQQIKRVPRPDAAAAALPRPGLRPPGRRPGGPKRFGGSARGSRCWLVDPSTHCGEKGAGPGCFEVELNLGLPDPQCGCASGPADFITRPIPPYQAARKLPGLLGQLHLPSPCHDPGGLARSSGVVSLHPSSPLIMLRYDAYITTLGEALTGHLALAASSLQTSGTTHLLSCTCSSRSGQRSLLLTWTKTKTQLH